MTVMPHINTYRWLYII